MKYFIFLNEFTLLRAVILTLLNRSVYLMPSRPVFGFFAKLFVWIARSMERRSNVHDVFNEFTDSRRYWSIPGYSNRTDIFIKLEDQINRRFKFNQIDQRLGVYAMSYKVETCKYMSGLYNAVFLIRDISQKYSSGEATIISSNDDLLFAYEKYYDEAPRPGLIKVKQFRPMVNFGFLVAVLLFSLVWALTRLRWRKYDHRSFFLAADFISGPAHIKLVRDIIGDPQQCLFVFRNATQRKNNAADISGFNQCINDKGTIALSELGLIIFLIVKDTLKLYFHSPHLAPTHMFPILKLPHKKATYRALLNRFKFKYFWCRDDYNSDHILRSQELRRVGSVSLGINHGLPSPCCIDPSWRYIDYDIYFVFGKHVPAKYYADTWSKKMLVKPVGSLGMTKEYLNRMSDPRPKDIIYFVSPNTHEEKVHHAVFEVARAFPEKKVWIKIKSNLKERGFYDDFIASCQAGPKNLFLTDANTYDLMFNVSFVLSGESTVVAEAIQFGLNVFAFDFRNEDVLFLYRDFPKLCVKTAAEAITRISDIETGKEIYPRQCFDDLIKLSGPYIIDVIRGDMGLGPTSQKNSPPEAERVYAIQ